MRSPSTIAWRGGERRGSACSSTGGSTPFPRDAGARAPTTRSGYANTARIPVAEHDELARRFEPKGYDPESWCRLAAEAGIRYVVVTSKHHDGFCLWDSKHTAFDGQWERTWNHAHGRALYDLCRGLQPSVIVNDRVDVGRRGHSGRIAEGYAGDYGTPEQTVPEVGLLDLDWETCLTMNRHWGWNEADRDWKSSKQLIRTLVDVVSKNGNLLLNVGPRADGTLPPEAVERLEAIGRWMAVNGESIHGTSGSPLERPAWGRVTVKREGALTTLYLHVFDGPVSS